MAGPLVLNCARKPSPAPSTTSKLDGGVLPELATTPWPAARSAPSTTT
jgi:hypothetical protein